jgi:hypothetical protein
VIPAEPSSGTRSTVGAAIYLASGASSFVTGEDHVVAGGTLRF